jgi:8-oxo-dGTP diphosphatase
MGGLRVVKILLWLWGTIPMPKWFRWMLLWIVNQKFLIGVSAVILNEQGEVLLFKHTYRGKNPWGFPGGWLMKREDPARAIEREICEESGVLVRALVPLEVTCADVFSQMDVIYLAKVESGHFQPSAEVSECGYFSPQEVLRLIPDSENLVQSALKEDALRRSLL